MFHSLCLMVENLRICNLRTAHICRYLWICDMQLNQEKFADLKFLDSHILEKKKKIGDFLLRIEPKNLGI